MPTPKRDPDEDVLLRRFRIVGAGAILLLISLLVISEVFDLPFGRTDSHVDPSILGLLVGAFLLLLGVETVARLPFVSGRGPKDDDKDG